MSRASTTMKPADEILDFHIRPVGDGLLLPANDLADAIERLAPIFQVSLRFELAHPGHPALHDLLRPLRRAHRFPLRVFTDPKEIHELAHDSILGGSRGGVRKPIPVLRRPRHLFDV